MMVNIYISNDLWLLHTCVPNPSVINMEKNSTDHNCDIGNLVTTSG